MHFLKIYFSSAERGVCLCVCVCVGGGGGGGGGVVKEDYGVEKFTEIKPMKVLVTSFDKFPHLCNLYVFGFYSVVPYISYKCDEV